MRMRAWSDEQVEQILGTLLRSGVIAAGAVVLHEGFSICCNMEAQSPIIGFSVGSRLSCAAFLPL
jgi:hypothetical protein